MVNRKKIVSLVTGGPINGCQDTSKQSQSSAWFSVETSRNSSPRTKPLSYILVVNGNFIIDIKQREVFFTALNFSFFLPER